MNMCHRYSVWALYFVLLLMMGGCSVKRNTIITIKGSDTMVNMMQGLAEDFMNMYPDYRVHITGGGSGNGIAALLNGLTDIASISRPLKISEINEAARRGIRFTVIPVAMDGIVVAVHASSPYDSLSLTQVKSFFTGTAASDAAVTLYGRENSSGTFEYFRDKVLHHASFDQKMQHLPGTAFIAEMVAKDPSAMGFGGVSYFLQRPGVKILALSQDSLSNAVLPVLQGHLNAEALRNGSYPLSRTLFLVMQQQGDEAETAFIRYLQSARAHKVMVSMSFIPVSGAPVQ